MGNQRTVRDPSQNLFVLDEASHGTKIWPYTPACISAIPKRLTLALAFYGMGFLATIPFLLKATSLTTACFSSVGMPCFVAGFLLYTVAIIKDLHKHGIL